MRHLMRMARFLITPSPRLRHPQEQERARLLLRLLVFSFPLILLGVAMELALQRWSGQSVDWLREVLPIGIGGWGALYFLGRTRYYLLTLYLTVFFSTAVILFGALRGEPHYLFYLVLVLIMTSFFARPLVIGLLGAGYFLLVVGLAFVSPGLRSILSPLSSALLVSAVLGVIGAAALRRAEMLHRKEIAHYDRHFRLLLQSTYDGLVVIQGERIENADSRFATLVGEPLDVLRGSDICHYVAFGFSQMDEEGGETVETLLRRRDQVVLPVEVLRTVFPQENRQVLAIRDITPRKEREAELERQALYDELTGLPNRRYLLKILPLYYQQLQYPLVHPSLLFIDLDDFKAVNDAAGHFAGDALLQKIAERLRNSLRNEDFVARYGGDEFVVIYNTPLGETTALIERVRQQLLYPYELGGSVFTVTVSIGVVRDIFQFADAESLLHHADLTMYQAKRSGKNQVVYLG